MDATSRIQFGLRGIATELKERLLAVPVYQRSFAWTKEQVAEFWTDLRDALASNPPEYFLGTIVLTRAGSNKATVIDGQQRLATTAILIARCNSHPDVPFVGISAPFARFGLGAIQLLMVIPMVSL